MQKLYISEYLRNTDAGRNIAKMLCSLEKDSSLEIEVIQIPNPLNNKNEWCRDYMPVKATNGDMILFTYNPSYLQDRKFDRETIPDQQKICKKLGLMTKPSDIILDGGAIEIHGKKAIISDRIITENTTSWQNEIPELLIKIKALLKLDELIIVPADPWDFTGHVDGLVRFIDADRILINDLSGLDEKTEKDNDEYVKVIYKKWKYNLLMSLENANLTSLVLPCNVHKNSRDESAEGIYMNFLKLNNCIVIPVFNDKDNDKKAQAMLESLYNKRVITIEAINLAKKGGVINCVTWTE